MPTQPPGVRTVHRTASLLRVLSSHGATGWRLSDLSEECGLDHSTTYRLLQGLCSEGLVTRVPDSRRYALGHLCHALGLACRSHFDLAASCEDHMRKLAADTRDIVFLNILSAGDSVCVARVEGRRALKAYTVEVGTRRALSLSAGGVAMLVHLPLREQRAIERENFRSISRRGEARLAAVRAMIERSRRLGYGLNMDDLIPGLAAIGVPILSADGRPAASISLGTSVEELQEPRRARLLARLQVDAARISALLPALRL